MKGFIYDIETDSLDPSKIWCIVTKDLETGEVVAHRYPISDYTSIFNRDGVIVGHNILGFDNPALLKVARVRIPDDRCIDTLVCSRLLRTDRPEGHSLEAWGEAFKFPKIKFDEWSAYDDRDKEQDRLDRIVKYCIQDVELNYKLFKYFEKYITSDSWRKSLRLEHDMAVICRELHDNGFYFNIEKARELYGGLRQTVEELTLALQKAFPPRTRAVSTITPRTTAHGTLHRGDFRWLKDGDLTPFSEGCTFSRFEWEPFNPGSPKQVVERLNSAGWKPFERTKGHSEAKRALDDEKRKGPRRANQQLIADLQSKLKEYETYGWKISEENLATLPPDAPEAIATFIKWRMLSKRLQTFEEWFAAYDERTHSIHGDFNPIGTWTHRASHSRPNQGNVPSTDSKYHSEELRSLARFYGHGMRSLFCVPPNRRLVGVDADGIQLRILAHYMNDEAFTNALVSGDKDNGTDVHSLNAEKLGIGKAQRPRAKTFIYAWLLGAGTSKVAKILGLANKEAGEAVDSFIRGYPGLERLKMELIPRDAARGYFEGLDGRYVQSDEYHMLAGYLQNGEAVVMKTANVIWRKKLMQEHISFRQVNWVHDEWQTEIPDDDLIAKFVMDTQMQAIVDAGVQLGVRCPLAGTGKEGYNWMDTH